MDNNNNNNNNNNNFRNHTKSSVRKVSSPIKLETLSKDKPHNRHSFEKSQTQPEHLSIDQYSSWQLPLISIYKTYPINKNSTDIAGEITTTPAFYFGFENSKSNGDKFLYLTGDVLQS